MDNIRLEPDDYIPILESFGIADYLDSLTIYSPNITDLIWEIKKFCIDNGLPYINLTGAQVERLFADLYDAGFITSKIYGGSNALPTKRSFVSGIKSTQDEISVDVPDGDKHSLRVYTNNGKHIQKNDTNKVSLSELNVKSKDEVKLCNVVDGVVGWMTSAVVA